MSETAGSEIAGSALHSPMSELPCYKRAASEGPHKLSTEDPSQALYSSRAVYVETQPSPTHQASSPSDLRLEERVNSSINELSIGYKMNGCFDLATEPYLGSSVIDDLEVSNHEHRLKLVSNSLVCEKVSWLTGSIVQTLSRATQKAQRNIFVAPTRQLKDTSENTVFIQFHISFSIRLVIFHKLHGVKHPHPPWWTETSITVTVPTIEGVGREERHMLCEGESRSRPASNLQA
ncbi:hypothetical protein RRG08_014266 [Elysia crispata]|uniref:Uncharacterized protein n=1 Tax=Elysia crispata TaxID=231223 RepID=A0AAE1B6S6_9GAST|nr:hypothetical protein RRG08_014266 [Elysia crispata]